MCTRGDVPRQTVMAKGGQRPRARAVSIAFVRSALAPKERELVSHRLSLIDENSLAVLFRVAGIYECLAVIFSS